MKIKKIFYFLAVNIFFVNCTVSPKEIEYGKDACGFCKMTIVETKFAAEIVTKKGRETKYDAIECMLNDIETKGENTLKYILITDYTKPKVLIDATKATYLISKKIKSPMGAFLSGYASKEEAQKNGGELYDWESLKVHFAN